MTKRSLTLPGRPRGLCAAALVAAALVLAGCSQKPVTRDADYYDPYEAQNRQVHNFNKAVDQAVLGGGPGKTGSVIPKPILAGVGNFADNLRGPSYIVNNVLQGRPGPAALNTLRFAVNTTFGIGGLFNVATALGMDEDPTDFGETLAVWGVPEGAYLEVPFSGPSTQRDLMGKVAGLAVDPVFVLAGPTEKLYVLGIYAAGNAASRQRYAETVNSILYESADSYAQSRLLYLQNRRFQLGEEEDVIDPYEDPYAE